MQINLKCCTALFIFLMSCCAMIITCVFSCCFQMQRRGWPKGSPWTASSITLRCCSARRMTCCTWALERSCSPSACQTSARPSCRRTYVLYLVKCGIDGLLLFLFLWFIFKPHSRIRVSDPATDQLPALDWIWQCQVFLFPLQLMWGTPAGKREECSFKGKNLEVRERSHLWKTAL